VYSVLGDEEKRCAAAEPAAALSLLTCRLLTSPPHRSGRCTTKQETRHVVWKALPALLLFVLTASTSVQGDLSGEQFDRLYRYYREVFAKARVWPRWALLVKCCASRVSPLLLRAPNATLRSLWTISRRTSGGIVEVTKRRGS
jgi:hypothetical protein